MISWSIMHRCTFPPRYASVRISHSGVVDGFRFCLLSDSVLASWHLRCQRPAHELYMLPRRYPVRGLPATWSTRTRKASCSRNGCLPTARSFPANACCAYGVSLLRRPPSPALIYMLTSSSLMDDEKRCIRNVFRVDTGRRRAMLRGLEALLRAMSLLVRFGQNPSSCVFSSSLSLGIHGSGLSSFVRRAPCSVAADWLFLPPEVGDVEMGNAASPVVGTSPKVVNARWSLARSFFETAPGIAASKARPHSLLAATAKIPSSPSQVTRSKCDSEPAFGSTTCAVVDQCCPS